MKNIILSGIQGSGKGTLAKMILDHMGDQVKYFEAGGMLRLLQSKPNAVGEYISSLIDHGNFIPDEFMVKLFELFLLSVEEGKAMLLDGFPRKPGETDQFIETMKTYNKQFTRVVLDINKETAIQRLRSRLICNACGAILNKHLHNLSNGCPFCTSQDLKQRIDDQDISKIETRFARYEDLCIPTLKKLEEQGSVVHIDASKSPQEVFEEVLKIMQK